MQVDFLICYNRMLYISKAKICRNLIFHDAHKNCYEKENRACTYRRHNIFCNDTNEKI